MKWFGELQITKVLNNPGGISFMSFLIGFGLMILMFHRPTFIEKTLSLPIDKVESQVIAHGNKCYKYRAEDSKCENADKE